jgi:hypothetical protein
MDSYHHGNDHGCERPELVSKGVVYSPHIVCNTGDDTGCGRDVKPSELKGKIMSSIAKKGKKWDMDLPQRSTEHRLNEVFVYYL